MEFKQLGYVVYRHSTWSISVRVRFIKISSPDLIPNGQVFHPNIPSAQVILVGYNLVSFNSHHLNRTSFISVSMSVFPLLTPLVIV